MRSPQPLRAIFACNANELPARAFLTYFTSKGPHSKNAFGFLPARHYRGLECGSEPRSNAMAISGCRPRRCKFNTTNGRVEGVTVVRDGQKGAIETDLVISNAGPKITVALTGEAAFPPSYVNRCAAGSGRQPNHRHQILRAGNH